MCPQAPTHTRRNNFRRCPLDMSPKRGTRKPHAPVSRSRWPLLGRRLALPCRRSSCVTPPTSAYTPNRLKKRYEPCTSMPGALGCMRLRCASVANARGASTRPTFYGVTVWTSETPRSCRLFSTRDPTIRLRMGDQSGRTHRCTCTMTVRMRRRLLPRDLCDV